MGDEIERSRDAELLERFEPEIEVLERLLGPVGAVVHYSRLRIMRTLEVANEATAGRLRELLECALDDDALRDLLLDVVEAARRTRVDNKIRALGRALAEGYLAGDDAKLDEQRIIVRALAAIDTYEIMGLIAMANAPAMFIPPEQALDRRLQEHGQQDLAEPIVAVLRQHGLVRDERRASSALLTEGSSEGTVALDANGTRRRLPVRLSA